MIGTWTIGLVLNGIIGAAFITVGTMLAVPLARERQWTSNRIAAVFTVLVLACGFGHLLRAIILVGPSFGWFGTTGLASRVEFADWHMWAADGVTALAGVFYVVARTRDKDLLQTARAFEDYRSHRARAIEVHDSVVQQLVEAQVALEAGQRAHAEEALQRGLQASKDLVSRVRFPERVEDDPRPPDPDQEGVRSDP